MKNAEKLVYGSRCVLCGTGLPLAGDDRLCISCAAALETSGRQRAPLTLAGCDGVAVPLRYEGRLREAMLALKFHGRQSNALWFAEELAGAIRAQGWEADALTYVPLGLTRWWQRGYNQAALIARETARLLELPCEKTLRRRLVSRKQSTLDAAARAENAAGAFFLRQGAELAGRRLILVDDILTTGATLSSCAALLRQAGCASVYAAAVMKA